MKGIIRFSLNNKFAVWILTVMIIFAGIYSGMNMKAETIPNINVPIMTVVTTYPGAAPQDVLDKVTEPLEQRLKAMDGVNLVRSNSAESYSLLILEYDYSKDMKEAESEAKEAVAALKFPQGVQSPTVSRISLNAFPVVTLSFSDDSKTPAELTELVQNQVQPAFQKVRGVADIQISGQQVEEVRIVPNQEKMAALGLTADTVKGMIQGSAVSFPLGVFELDRQEKVVLVDGNIRSLEDLRNLALPMMPTNAGGAAAPGGAGGLPAPGGVAAPGASAPADAAGGTQAQSAAPATQAPAAPAAFGLPTVKLGDVADLEVISQSESISRTNGKEAIGINIVKSPDANTVDVVNGIKDEAKLLQEEFPGLKVDVTLDQAVPIEQSIHTMLSKAMFGALFAVVIIMLFLRNIRSTIISIISIPLSLLMAILLLNQMDITLNMMTLGAMTVAIGRVVDDSIVVIENIYRRMHLSTERLKGKELVLEATREMFSPILSSTIVTIAVFFPLALVTGPIGQLFMDFALAIVFALLASLVVAITVVPMLAHSLLLKGKNKGKAHSEESAGKLGDWYKRMLDWSLNHKLATFLSAVILLVGSFGLFPLIGVSFLPGEEEKTVTITYSPAPAELKQDVEALALKVEEYMMKREGIEVVQYSVGGSGNPFAQGASKSALFMGKYNADMKGFAAEKEQVLDDLKALGAPGEFKHQDFSGGMSGGSDNLSIFIYGQELEDIQPAAGQIMEKLKASSNFSNVDSSLSKSYDQYRLVVDQAKASALGLTAGQIGMELMPTRERPVVTTVEKDGKDLNVYLDVPKDSFTTLADLENKKLQSPLGIPVSVKDVVTVQEGESPNTLSRRDGLLYVEVSAKILSKDVGKATQEIKDEIDSLNLPSELDVEFGGVTADIEETFTQLGLAMLAAIAIVYFVLVLTFGGALAPFAILFSLPFTIIGGLVALFVAGETLSVSAMIGALMLIGIVVTNAIVLIDRVIQKEKEGMSTRNALLEAAATRLRPILMTALATIGALLPLAFGFEEGGAMISKGLGITVIGGLTSSTLLTLLIVPVVYEFLRKFSRKQTAEE